MHLAAWPVFLPLIAGFIVLFAKAKGLLWQRTINLLAVSGLVVLSIALIKESSSGTGRHRLVLFWC